MGIKAPPTHSQESVAMEFEALYAKMAASMIRLAVLLVDDRPTAEDVVQDAFVGLHENWLKLSNPSAAAAYVRRSVINGARSSLRRRRTARAWVPPHSSDAPSAEEMVLTASEHREVLSALKTLPEKQREVLILRYWAELSESDIADALGVSRGTVKSNAHRGLRTLEKKMHQVVAVTSRGVSDEGH